MSWGSITLKDIIHEDFVNYKKACMTLIFPYCDFKCNREAGKVVCQNHGIVELSNVELSVYKLIHEYYAKNPISHALVLQGLEPFHPDSLEELYNLLYYFAGLFSDDIVIYTGYTEQECISMGIIKRLKAITIDSCNSTVIIKFGRFIPGDEPHYDELLGVKLASDNQYAKLLSDIKSE